MFFLKLEVELFLLEKLMWSRVKVYVSMYVYIHTKVYIITHTLNIHKYVCKQYKSMNISINMYIEI